MVGIRNYPLIKKGRAFERTPFFQESELFKEKLKENPPRTQLTPFLEGI